MDKIKLRYIVYKVRLYTALTLLAYWVIYLLWLITENYIINNTTVKWNFEIPSIVFILFLVVIIGPGKIKKKNSRKY